MAYVVIPLATHLERPFLSEISLGKAISTLYCHYLQGCSPGCALGNGRDRPKASTSVYPLVISPMEIPQNEVEIQGSALILGACIPAPSL